jgi:hypothetical protein
MVRKINLRRSTAPAAVFMVIASMTASTGVAAVEPNNGPVTVGEASKSGLVTAAGVGQLVAGCAVPQHRHQQA